MSVALLAEGVGRNFSMPLQDGRAAMSPSSRRAWIEMSNVRLAALVKNVALLAEGVDRNIWPSASNSAGRSSPNAAGAGC